MNGMPRLSVGMDCCGCGACAAACMRSAIQMTGDSDGFLNPNVDAAKCVGCMACERVCSNLVARNPVKPLAVYATRAKDDVLRQGSSSGGVSSLLARLILQDGGAVFGVRCDSTDGNVAFAEARTESEFAEFRGSKYVQADTGCVYRDVKRCLEAGCEVLFVGTPCQVAALKSYLGRDYDRLLSVDFVCHGVPSPLAWKRFLAQHGDRGFSRIVFRDKRAGWRKYAMRVVTTDGRDCCSNLKGYTYLWGFIADLYNRRSCHQCHFRNGCNASDITIGDYWGVEERFPALDDNRGVSLVVIRTHKGESWFARMLPEVVWAESDWDHAVKGNPSLVSDVRPHAKREEFFARLSRGEPFDEIVRDLLDMGFFRRIVKRVGRMLKVEC